MTYQITLYNCLRELEKVYDYGTDTEVQETLQNIFSLTDVDLYSLVLAIAKESKLVDYSQRKSIAEITLYKFKDWLRRKGHSLVLTNGHKDDAMSFLVTSGLKFTDVLCEIYQLDKGLDREYLVRHLEYIYDSKNDPKTAATVAISLKLQDFIEPEKLLLPLIAADKFQVAEAILKDSPTLQHRYAELLNWMCGMGEDDLLQYIQGTCRLRIVDKTKFQSKTLIKISEKAVKKYNLDPVKFPKIFRKKNLSSLKYLVSCKFKSPHSEFSKWDGLIKVAVASDPWLQEQLMFLLTYQYHDALYAAALARHFNIPHQILPPKVKKELENNSNFSRFETDPKSNMPSLVSLSKSYNDDFADNDDYFDDGTGDGFMFASDDITYDEAIGVEEAIEELRIKEEYWTHPLQESSIKFINSCDALKRCIKIVFKGGNIIGFDGEWQPKYGRAGYQDKMAIMQLALKDEVYIIDILEFDKSEEGQNLLKVLFKKLFTSEDTVRLGYGIDSDIKVITENYPYANEFLNKTKNFEDLLYLSRQILKLPCVIEKLRLQQTGKDKEKGLSQLVKQCFGKPLDKTYQVSDWAQRPLSKEQLRYAALDALCLVKIYDVFEDLAAEFQIIISSQTASGDCQRAADFQSRVPEEPVVTGPPQSPKKFAVVCDTMLQGLGKALRCCGVDTVILQNGEEHTRAIELFLKEKRVILTRGKSYHEVRGYAPEEMCMHVPEGSTAVQISAVFQRYNVRVKSKDMFSRCQICNGDKYIKVKKEHMLLAFWIKNKIRPNDNFVIKHNLHELRGSRNNHTGIDFRHITIGTSCVPLQCEFVPTAVFEHVDIFFVCAKCGKVYWQGSHLNKVTEQFSHVIVDSDEDEAESFYEHMEA